MNDNKTKLTISFIIPVLNGEKFVERCLTSITKQMQPSDELIIIDNGSTDRTAELVKNFEMSKLIESKAPTISSLRNLGAAQAKGDTLAFIDIDCVICSGWRQAAEKVLSDSAVAATGSLYDLPENPSWIEAAWWSSKPKVAEKSSYMVGGNFVIRKNIFHALDGFDQDLITDEDSDIGDRLNKQGYILIDDPEVGAIHLGNPKSLGEFISKEKWHSASIVATMKKNGIDKPMVMTFAFMALALVSLAMFLYGAWFDTKFLLLSLLFLTVPIITAAYRVTQYRHYRFFLPLLVLYLLFYTVRSITILETLGTGGSKHSKN